MIQRIEEQKKLRNTALDTIRKYVSTSSLLLYLVIIFMGIPPTSLFYDKKSEYVRIHDKMKPSPLHSKLSVEKFLNKAAHFAGVSGEIT